MIRRVASTALIALLWVGCFTSETQRSARVYYNDGLKALAEGDFEEAQKQLIDARNEAGQDPELRFRAAFNLGMAYAEEADGVAAEDPSAAVDKLRQSAAWFQDAVRLRPKNGDARVNLEVVLKRTQLLADQINKGKNGLQPRLERLIEDQRGLRDHIRQLMTKIEAAGAGAEPVGFQSEFEALATAERMLLAEAGTVSDLTGDELGLLEGKPEDERTPEDKSRIIQLGNLDHYVQAARVGVADARRNLRRLQGDKAHRRADAGLGDLKRAREQLLDPVAVLRGIASDEMMLLQHTTGLARISAGTLTLDAGQKAVAPPWLTTDHLGERQGGIAERGQELLARLAAGVEQGGADPQAGADPKMKRMLAAAAEAVPLIRTAVDEMASASSALAASQTGGAAIDEQKALEALVRAIERFADLRTLIELTHQEQTRIIALLTPPEKDAADAPAMTTKERIAKVVEGVANNTDRLARLAGMFADEVKAAEAKAAAPADPNAAAQSGADPDAAQKQLEATKQRFQLAEQHRAAAADSLARLAALMQPGARRKKGDPTAIDVAKEGLAHIEELRRLFFSIVEHLKELLRDQSETHDKTASARDLDDAARDQQVGPLADFQQRHAGMGDALAQALAQQADAAAANPQPAPGQPDPAKVAEAATEVRGAAGQMTDAATALGEARDSAGAVSFDMEPVLDYQKTAMEQLAQAIRLLEPPKQDQQKKDQKDQQKQQQQQQQQQDPKQVSQQEAQRRLQAIRDREAERQRKKRDRQRSKPEPVEKDW